MADRTGDAVTDYVLTASRFDQVVARHDNGAPRRVIKHRRGALVTGLSDAEADRLLRAGAIRAAQPPAAQESGSADPASGHDDHVHFAPNAEPPAAGADASAQSGTVVERPKQMALKDEWVKYAAARGMAEAEAEALTKSELIERFGQD